MKNDLRERVRRIIFDTDTLAGRVFDMGLLAAILGSTLLVVLETLSIPLSDTDAKILFRGGELFFTLLFTAELILRALVARPLKGYLMSFYGFIDILSVAAGIVSLLVPLGRSLVVIRFLRVSRIFRVFKLAHFVQEQGRILGALKRSLIRIGVFLTMVFLLIVVLGALMFSLESEESGFTSIPQSIYWAIVTITTVGYGDIAPQTVAGKVLASLIMLLGYAIIAVPTGMVTSEILISGSAKPKGDLVCRGCEYTGHDEDALWCKYCGSPLRRERVTSSG